MRRFLENKFAVPLLTLILGMSLGYLYGSGKVSISSDTSGSSSVSESVAGETLYKIGSPANDYGIVITLTNFVCNVKTPSGANEPEGKYCVATLKLENNSGTALENYHYWWDETFIVKDSHSREFPMAFVGDTDQGYAFNHDLTFDQYLKGVGPGFSRTYQIPFDLPVDAKPVEFTYKGSYTNSDPITYKFGN